VQILDSGRAIQPHCLVVVSVWSALRRVDARGDVQIGAQRWQGMNNMLLGTAHNAVALPNWSLFEA